MKTSIKVLGIVSILLFGLLAFKPLEEKRKIVIDAGHGGKDFGAKVNDHQEKIISESIAQKIKALNQNQNVEIVLLREGDHFMELSERAAIINNLKPNLVVSLHVRAHKNLEVNGVEAYISSKNQTFNTQSKELAENVIDKISKEGSLAKRSVIEAPFYILKNVDCPAVLLEMGFLSNEKDRNYITSEKGQNEIASKILEAIQ